MAVVTKNTSAKLRLTNDKDKTICTLNKVDPGVNLVLVDTFANAINTLRKDEMSFKYLIVESELVAE